MDLAKGMELFLDGLDEGVYARGLDYYETGQVRYVEKCGEEYHAEVAGRSATSYDVSISISSDGQVEECDCDCPYGAVCKHIVAVLFAIENGEVKEKQPNKILDFSKLMESLVAGADREKLVEIVNRRVKTDSSFEEEIALTLGAPVGFFLEKAKSNLERSLWQNACEYMEYAECANIRSEMDRIMYWASKYLENGQGKAAFLLVRTIMLMGEELPDAEMGMDEDGYLSLNSGFDGALQIMEESLALLAEAPATEKSQVLAVLLDDVQGESFNVWEDWRYQMLRMALCLTEAQDEEKVLSALEEISAGYYGLEEDDEPDMGRIVRYELMRHLHGAPAASSYLEQNLDVDALRSAAIEEALSAGRYDQAEQLCCEKIQHMEERLSTGWRSAYEWEKLLDRVYKESGNRRKQLEQEKHLLMSGHVEYLDRIRELLTEDGVWETERIALLEEMQKELSCYTYMEVLSAEGEMERLMAQVRSHPESVFSYGKQLAAKYGREVFEICTERIIVEGDHASTRYHYQAVCGQIDKLVKFGGIQEARELIEILRKNHSRRPAFMDELRKLEARSFR